jgi:putative transposase
VITAASVQDRDAARPLVWNLSRSCTRIRLAWADASWIHRTQAGGLRHPAEDPAGDRPQARRARLRNPAPPLGYRGTLAWMISCRQCALDYERLPESHEAMVLWAMTALMA